MLAAAACIWCSDIEEQLSPSDWMLLRAYHTFFGIESQLTNTAALVVRPVVGAMTPGRERVL